jgi:ribosomal protein L37E
VKVLPAVDVYTIVIGLVVIGLAALPLIAFINGRRRIGPRLPLSLLAYVLLYWLLLLVAVGVTVLWGIGVSHRDVRLLMVGLVVGWGLGLSLFIMASAAKIEDQIQDPHELCRGCGYNLRSNESGVCPECGSPISPAQRKYLAKVKPVGSAQSGNS